MRLGLDAGADTLDLAVELGVRGVPISADRLAAGGVEATLGPLRERGLAVCQIGAFGFNPLSEDTARQEQQAALLKSVIPLAAETGCPYIVINGGNYHPSGFLAVDARNYAPDALDKVADAVRPMLALAEACGAKLTIEVHLKTAVNSVERFLSLWNRLGSPALCANVDPSSLYVYEDVLDAEERVREVCTGLAGHYGLVHFKDFALADGAHIHINLAPMGHGPTDWAQMLGLIAPHMPDDSWAIIEHVQSAEEARSSVRLLRAAAEEAGVTLG